MKTKMGTHVAHIHGVDVDGYCDCVLVFSEHESDRRDIHISDLRTENSRDESLLRSVMDRWSNTRRQAKSNTRERKMSNQLTYKRVNGTYESSNERFVIERVDEGDWRVSDRLKAEYNRGPFRTLRAAKNYAQKLDKR